ncbi:OCIA domain-containing protein 2 [Chanos chanos]|uniref:OCIA domain-containing protein 2 n=1 Tax=Chanos chanos TaxID=29144 RepID=A0A6J2V9W9_CHACN|nr:OCIA domain-containing protein 2 [Chanos chanos]
MSAQVPEQTGTEKAAGTATGPHRKWPVEDRHVNRDNLRRLWKECQEESFWYRALPLSVGSMAVTGGLIYNGVWKASKRFGPFPKLALAGILGYAVGKASYITTCREKFHNVGLEFGPGSGFGPGFWGPHPGHRHCHHVCEECKKTEAQAASAPPTQN